MEDIYLGECTQSRAMQALIDNLKEGKCVNIRFELKGQPKRCRIKLSIEDIEVRVDPDGSVWRRVYDRE